MNRAAELVREARRQAGLTQAELARRVGTTQSDIARVESGRVDMRFGRVIVMLDACGFDLDSELRERKPFEFGELEGPEGVDRSQIRRQLAMTPAERVADMAESANVLMDFRDQAQRSMRR